MRALKCLRNIEIIRKKHEMAVAKQQSEVNCPLCQGHFELV